LFSPVAATLWYHDHALGITRLNVYAGGAGFYLIRTPYDGETGLLNGVLPGPAPKLGEDPNGDPAVRMKIREIPIAIQLIGPSLRDSVPVRPLQIIRI